MGVRETSIAYNLKIDLFSICLIFDISLTMVSSVRQVVIFLTIVGLLTASASANNSRPPRNNDISNMADALKYLQDLDTYYGDRARVRFGKRASLMQLLRNHLANEQEVVHPVDLSNAEEPF